KIAFDGMDIDDYTIDQKSLPIVLGPHRSDSIKVCFHAPLKLGVQAGIQIVVTAHSDKTEPTENYSWLNGTTPDCVTLGPSYSVPFWQCMRGGHTDTSFTMTNNLDETIYLTGITPWKETMENHGEYFSFPSLSLPLRIEAHATITVPVRFAPKEW